MNKLEWLHAYCFFLLHCLLAVRDHTEVTLKRNPISAVRYVAEAGLTWLQTGVARSQASVLLKGTAPGFVNDHVPKMGRVASSLCILR